ncbi:unnamed protein product [Fraxinus pennsylvanica]|uniref:Polygalacturonase n=1 Tax=Fraxinus pennsylvanica TaxID=56036 RepID=A0AAD1ZWH4_9LAMI|nr:unnamed protein product [Fraxinus pennsylvanica]
MKISAPGNSPNTDGIHVAESSRVTIMNSKIGTGDECVSIGPGTSNLWIENVACGPGHGISIGSLAWQLQEPEVQNVTVKSTTFTGTQNGVRVKTWARPSKGFVKYVLFQHLVMVSGVKIRHITYHDIHRSSATKIAMKFDCSSDINLKDVKLTYNNEPAHSSCINANGKASGLVQPNNCLAWTSACASTQAATIYVPPGRFLLRTATFSGQSCKNQAINMRIDGTLVAPSNYNVIGNSGTWIKFERVTGVSVIGGTLDGRGANLWACKNSGKSCPNGATTLAFYNSKNIIINGLSSINSQKFHIQVYGSQNAKLVGMKISAPGNSPNTGGIHVAESSRVTIMNSKIGTGDDCVSIGPGTSNLWIENVACGPGHGISIGSLAWQLQEPGVQNVTVKSTTFTGTQNGVRVKTWARPSKGFVKYVLFQHLAMVNVRNPIIIDQNYCPHHRNCPNQVSGVKISHITYHDIHGSSATKIAMKFDCSKGNPCSDINLKDVKLTYNNELARSSCIYANGKASGLVQPNNCLYN